MARSSLGGCGSDGDGGYTSLHVRVRVYTNPVTPPARGALPALMQNVPHLLIYFLFPLYRSLLLASGLLHVDRRPIRLLLSTINVYEIK